MSIEPGTRVSHYEILSELGRGGMAVVYHARDLELEREVALKQPGDAIASDPIVKRRFLREARAASRLMHPNIVPVLEVFEVDGQDWLVMEYIEGTDLRKLIRERGALPVSEVLVHAEGLAEALQLAHRRGVLHRDIKTNNVMIGNDGRATDFGLVRFFVPPGESSEAPTLSTSLTAAGRTVGTPAYMSPEQALGQPVDPRSDIYSFGVVLYEMCVGSPAVTESEFGAVLDAVLNREPRSISRLNYEVPEELERIIRKCIRKDPDERYQNMQDLLVDLRALHRRGDESTTIKRWRWWHSAMVLVGVIGVVWGGREVYRGVTAPAVPPAFQQPRQVTAAPGWEADPAISPDGGEIVYASDQEGSPDLWLIDVAGGNPLQLTHGPATDRTPAWTSDGSSILFTSDRSGENAIWRIPRLGGQPTMVVPRGLDPAVSPDGRHLAFAIPVASGELRIATVALDGAGETRVLTQEGDGLWIHRFPAWSPDGSTLCYADWRHLWLVPTDGGRPRQLTFDGLADTEPVWSRDGRFVYFSSARSSTAALWRIAVEGGEPTQITQGTGPERRPSLSRNGSRMAYSTLMEDPDLIVVDLQDGQRHRMSSMGVELNAGIAPDSGELVFVSNRWGQRALWSQSLVGGKPTGAPRRLTDHPGTASNPAFSPDGQWIAYHRVLNDQRDVWIVPSTGGPPTQFTEDPGVDIHPAWSPDGSLIAFASDRDGNSAIWVKPVVDGRPNGQASLVATSTRSVQAPVWSPRGRWIAFVAWEQGGSEVYVVPADGSDKARRVTEGARAVRVAWDKTPDSLLISGWWDTGAMKIRRVPLAGGAGEEFYPPVEFGPVAALGDFDVTADGKTLVFTREEVRGDVWIMDIK